MRSRQNLSIKNKWIDKDNFIYSIYKVEDLAELMGSAESSIIRWKKELREHFLIEEVQVGMTKCNRIYVFDVNTTEDLEVEKKMYEEENKDDFKELEGQISIEDFNDNSIYQSVKNNNIFEREMIEYKNILRKNFDLDRIKDTYERKEIEEIIELILDTICFKNDNEKIKISDGLIPIEIVKKRLLNLEKCHLDYTLSCIRKAPKINNLRAYLLTSLYNSYSTFNQSIVNDLKKDDEIFEGVL